MLKRMAMVGLAMAALVGCQERKNSDSAADAAKAVTCEVLPGLTLQLPHGWKLDVEGGVPTINVDKAVCHMQIWPVEAAAPADVLPCIAEIARGEVVEFKAAQTTDLTIAGGAAKQVVGAGVEADDKDPSKVEAFVFSVGGKVYLLVAHSGEDDPAGQLDQIVGMLNTAKVK